MGKYAVSYIRYTSPQRSGGGKKSEERLRKFTREPRFAVDCMLGEVMKWLRFLGFDAQTHPGPDREVLSWILEEGRVLVTSDKAFAKKAGETSPLGSFLVQRSPPHTSMEVVELIFEILQRLNIPFPAEEKWLTVCPLCGLPLSQVKVEDYLYILSQGKWPGEPVPPNSLLKTEDVYLCVNCPKTFWEGSHTDSIRRTVRKALKVITQMEDKNG